MNVEGGTSRSSTRASRQAADDLATVLATDSGRRFIRRLLAETGVFTPVSTMEEAAVQRVGLALIAEMNALAPTIFPRLMMDAANEQVQTTPERASLATDGDDDE